MMTSVIQQSQAASNDIPPHVLIVGKKGALDYIAPALFRIGTFGEILIKAKGSLSIVTAVNVAEMVKRDVAGLETQPIRIGTSEFVADGMTRRVSFIEIHLARRRPEPALPTAAPALEGPPALEAPKKNATKKRAPAKKRAARKKADA
jgi:DNA-binding protein Alba